MRAPHRLLVLAALPLALAACEGSTTAPATDDPALLAGSVAGSSTIASLFDAAIAKVRAERGEAAANEYAASYRKLAAEAAALRAAGERVSAERKQRAADEEAARVAINVLGTNTVEREIALVGTGLDRLRGMIADGERSGATNLAALRETRTKVTTLQTSAREKAAKAMPVSALLDATAAVDLLLAAGVKL